MDGVGVRKQKRIPFISSIITQPKYKIQNYDESIEEKLNDTFGKKNQFSQKEVMKELNEEDGEATGAQIF